MSVKKVTNLPMLKHCSPVWKAHPITMSSMSYLLTLVFATRLFTTSASKFTGFTSINSPFLAIVKGDLESVSYTHLTLPTKA